MSLYEATDLTSESSEDSAADGGISSSKEHTAILDWLSVPWIFCVPLFGSFSFQIVHMLVICGALVALIAFVSTGAREFSDFLTTHALPDKIWYSVLLAPFAVLMAAVKLVVARRMLLSKVLNDFFCKIQPAAASDAPNLTFGGILWKALQRSDTKPTTAMQRLRSRVHTNILVNVFGLPLSCTLFYVIVWWVFKFDWMWFVKMLLPWLVSLPASQVSNVVISFSCALAYMRVHQLRSELDDLCSMVPVVANGSFPEANVEKLEVKIDAIADGFFTEWTQKYFALDADLTRISQTMVNVLLFSLSVLLVVGYMALLIAALDINLAFFAMVTLLACTCVAISMVYPLAKVSDFCHSNNTAVDIDDQSLFVIALQVSKLPMQPSVRGEYLSLIQIMQACPLGVKFPFFGLVTVEALMNIVKVIAAIFPAAITFALTHLAVVESK